MNLLKLLTLSAKRREILLRLSGKRRSLRDFREMFGDISQSLIPELKKLEAAGLIEKKGNVFLLTNLGEVVVESMRNFLNTVEAVDEYGEFFKTHRIDVFPEEFLHRIGELRGGKVLKSTRVDLLLTYFEYRKLLDKATVIRGISPVFYPDFVETFHHLVEKGKRVELILTKEVVDLISSQYKEIFNKCLENENFGVWVYLGEVRFTLTVSDVFVSLGLFNRDGTYDVTRDLICRSASSLKWGSDLFEYFKGKSWGIQAV